MATIVCEDPRHALRFASSGWASSLGTTTGSTTGYLCEACVRLRKAEATTDTNHTTNQISVQQGGSCIAEVGRRYSDGQIVEMLEKRGNLSNWPTGGNILFGGTTRRQALVLLLADLRDWLLTRP